MAKNRKLQDEVTALRVRRRSFRLPFFPLLRGEIADTCCGGTYRSLTKSSQSLTNPSIPTSSPSKPASTTNAPSTTASKTTSSVLTSRSLPLLPLVAPLLPAPLQQQGMTRSVGSTSEVGRRRRRALEERRRRVGRTGRRRRRGRRTLLRRVSCRSLRVSETGSGSGTASWRRCVFPPFPLSPSR
jgi:hypothetical protein